MRLWHRGFSVMRDVIFFVLTIVIFVVLALVARGAEKL
jgi:hypothetical protein